MKLLVVIWSLDAQEDELRKKIECALQVAEVAASRKRFGVVHSSFSDFRLRHYLSAAACFDDEKLCLG